MFHATRRASRKVLQKLGTSCRVQASAVPLQHRCFADSTNGLSQDTINIVKATAPVLAEHGYAITTTMYKRMLSENSKVKELFNPSHQVVLPNEVKARQPWSLACSVHAYAQNVDNLSALTEAVERIAQKHVSLAVLPEHYPIVGENLLWAIKEVLGDAATPEIMTAWEEAYGFLANIFVERERQLREEKAAQPGGWELWREFVVEKKIKESDEVQSFLLKPKDGDPLPTFQPGQYTAVRVETPEFTTQRNYTISSGPDSPFLRITVKREPPLQEGCPAGQISGYLHDKVNAGDSMLLAVPCGDFTMQIPDDKPIVLLAGGVGVTPIMSMLEYLVDRKVTNNIVCVNTARNPGVEAMHESLRRFRRGNLNLIVKTLYDQGPEDYPKGPLTSDLLEQVLVSKDAHYYFCGPEPFMKTIYQTLQDWKVPQSQIHFEYFGPHVDLAA